MEFDHPAQSETEASRVPQIPRCLPAHAIPTLPPPPPHSLSFQPTSPLNFPLLSSLPFLGTAQTTSFPPSLSQPSLNPLLSPFPPIKNTQLVPPGHVVLPARWLVRFALVLAASAELVKARFLIFAPPPAPSGSGSGPGSGSGSNPDSDPDSGSDGDGAAAFSAQYFFYMYVSYLSVQLALAGLALVWRPGKATGLVEAEDDQHGGGYLVRTGSPGVVG